MQEGPGPIGPRKPAVPNCKKPEKYFRRVISSLDSMSAFNCAAVTGSGSSAIHALTSVKSSESINLE